MHTTYKALAGQEKREFIDKKLCFMMRDEKIQLEETSSNKKGRSYSPAFKSDKYKSTTGLAYYTYFTACANAPESLHSFRGYHLTSKLINREMN